MKQTIYKNAKFLSLDKKVPEIKAMLVTDGIITAMADEFILTDLAPDAEIRDLKNATLLPGFIDSHSHLTAVAYQLLIARLNPAPIGTCNSTEAVIQTLKEHLSSHPVREGQWLIGMGYDNSALENGAHPTCSDLDKVSVSVPVIAVHISGHMAAANTKALELLGYADENPVVPEGGLLTSDGLLKENAFLAPEKQALIAGPSKEELLEAIGKASELYASYGITTACEGKAGISEYQLLRAADERGLLKTDVIVYLTPEAAKDILPHQMPMDNPYEGHIRLAGCKIFLDGSPQGKTAWLSEPYLAAPEGEPETYCGIPIHTDDYVSDCFKMCIKNHWQITVHANGDAAIEQMIRCYRQALCEVNGTKTDEDGNEKPKIYEDLRPVAVHCQTVSDNQLSRMQTLGIVPSFFHDHVYYWGDYYKSSILGEKRAERISPLRSAVKRGMAFTLHQDSPVVPPNIIFSMHLACNRITSSGEILGSDQTINIDQAVNAATIFGAYQIFEDLYKGSITCRKRADFVVLDKNPLETSDANIADIQVLMTIKDDSIIYRK